MTPEERAKQLCKALGFVDLHFSSAGAPTNNASGAYLECLEAIRQARTEAIEEAARVAENEPEPEGPAPSEVMLLDPDDACLFGIRATKTCIAAAIRAHTATSL